MTNELTVEQIEDAFPENDLARNSVMYSCEDGFTKASAQWLHDFARNIHASDSNVIADAPESAECRDSEVIKPDVHHAFDMWLDSLQGEDRTNIYNMNKFDLSKAAWDAALSAQPVAQPAFQMRDTSKPAEAQGLFQKFEVRRVDDSDSPGGKHFGCRYFVIDMDHDEFAPNALRHYAQDCKATHPTLAADLECEFGVAQPVEPIAFILHDGNKGDRLVWMAPPNERATALCALAYPDCDAAVERFWHAYNEATQFKPMIEATKVALRAAIAAQQEGG